jgi:Rrf2 family protein
MPDDAVARPTNTQFALAVHMVTLLASRAPEPLSSEEMAGSAGSNPVHVRRVLGGLREAGLVTSRPGVGGGWSLVADPATTTLADVWRVVQRDDPVLGLHGANPDCSVGQGVQAALVGVDRRAAAAIEAELATTTIAELVAQTAAGDLRAAS